MLHDAAIWFLSISLADCISSGGSRICFLMLAMSVFSGQTRRDGGFGNRGNAEHGTKHVLHVGALTPQSFRQMAGDIWSVDGYRISKTHSRPKTRPNFHQIACWPVRDPAYIHIQSFKLLWCPWFASFKRKALGCQVRQVLLCLCPAFGLPNFSADLVLTTCRTWETSGPQNAPQTEPHVRGVANLLDSVFALEPLP